jgi:hypothetical protein
VRIAGWLARTGTVNRALVGVAVLVVLPALLLSNLDVLGATRPMELLLFQPSHWSYLWSR